MLDFEMRLSFRAFGALDLQNAVSRSSFSSEDPDKIFLFIKLSLEKILFFQ